MKRKVRFLYASEPKDRLLHDKASMHAGGQNREQIDLRGVVKGDRIRTGLIWQGRLVRIALLLELQVTQVQNG